MFYLLEHNVFLNNVLCGDIEALVSWEAIIYPILDKYIPWLKKIKVFQ